MGTFLALLMVNYSTIIIITLSVMDPFMLDKGNAVNTTLKICLDNNNVSESYVVFKDLDQ